MKIWINTGELSADVQSAAVLTELKKIQPNLEAVGMGGDNLEKAGMRCLHRIEELSVMGLGEVIRVLPKIFMLLRRIRKNLELEKPDAVLLTDAPDFNFFVARMAKKLNIPVYYFIPPKVWAWRKKRINFLKSNIKKIFSILPFEQEFYEENNIAVEYVGNPLVSLVNYDRISEIKPSNHKIGLMPGSRKKEIESLLPQFAKCAEILQQTHPKLEFHLIKAPHFSDDYIKKFWPTNVKLHIEHPENRYAFMRTCPFLLAASGTATLESALAGVPTIVCYIVSPMTAFVAKKVLKIKYVSLANLIVNKELFPECLQENATPENISKIAQEWLNNPSILEQKRDECEHLRELCGDDQGAKRMANSLIRDLYAKKD